MDVRPPRDAQSRQQSEADPRRTKQIFGVAKHPPKKARQKPRGVRGAAFDDKFPSWMAAGWTQCLAGKGKAMGFNPKSILWPTDFSPRSMRGAVHRAMCEKFDARLHVVHIAADPRVGASGLPDDVRR